MIEIVFSDSAAGSLRQAQHYGAGKYRGFAGGVFYSGDKPSREEIMAAQRAAEERARREWERAVPLGGKAEDLYCFGLALSMGGVSDDDFWGSRHESFESLYSVWPRDDAQQRIEEKLRKCREALTAVCRRAAVGEDLRVWYSCNPDELCGLYWLMSRLQGLKEHGAVYAVKLPEWEDRGDGTVVWRSGCGELGPGEWGRYAAEQKLLPPAFIAGCAMHWRKLQEENAPLRAVLNGQLVSAPEDIYDGFIRRELSSREAEFFEAGLIGDVLGKYRLGLGDAWVHFRIEEMIRRGELEAVTEAPEDGPVYRRMLRKRNS